MSICCPFTGWFVLYNGYQTGYYFLEIKFYSKWVVVSKNKILEITRQKMGKEQGFLKEENNIDN